MKYICLFIFIISAFPSYSQQKKTGEVGLNIGGSYYLGDYNKIPFVGTRLSAGAFYRHGFNTRYAVRGSFNYIQLYANSNSIPHPADRPTPESFSKTVYDLNAVCEFNFIPFLPVDKKYVYSPYVLAGFGLQYIPQKEKQFVLAIPFGVGVKYNLNQYLSVAIETSFYKTFSDFIDTEYEESDLGYPRQTFYEGTNDWYSIFGIKLAYKIKYKVKCHAFD